MPGAATPTLWPGGRHPSHLAEWDRRISLMPGARKGPAAAKVVPGVDLPMRKVERPTVTIMWGRRGMGKTLGMTTLGKIMHDRYRRNGMSNRIMANYHVEFADLCAPYLVDRLVEFPHWAHDMLALVDELTAFFPNRRSMNSRNLNFSTFLQQIRKNRIELIFTTQFPTDVDRQILQQIDYFVEPEIFYLPGTPGKHLALYIHDWWGQYTGRYFGRDGRPKRWPPPKEDADWVTNLYNVHLIHDLYDSSEVVAPAFTDFRQELVNRSWAEEIAAEDAQAATSEIDGLLDRLSQRLSQNQRVSTTLEQLIDSQPPEGIDLRLVLDQAKQLDPSIKTTASLKARFEARGWTVTRNKSSYIAERL